MSKTKNQNNLLQHEQELYQQGYHLIAGTDEAGRGSIAGPLVVAACILPEGYVNPAINDSKKLSITKRKALAAVIKQVAVAYHIQVYSPEFVDIHNPKQTSRLGMLECMQQLNPQPDFILSDFEPVNLPLPQRNLVKGDATSQTIAAASILAKATRDELMEELDKQYPEYNFIHNQGYLNKTIKQQFLNGELKHIPGVHRLSYEPLKSILAKPKK